jgi:hypothetical protein
MERFLDPPQRRSPEIWLDRLAEKKAFRPKGSAAMGLIRHTFFAADGNPDHRWP